MILLQASTGIAIDSQLLGAVVGALIVILCAAVGHLYSTSSSHGERITKVEVTQEFYLRSAEQNRREVVTPNPLTPLEEAILEVVVNEGGDKVTVDELEIAARALYRESVDESKTAGEREKYKNLLPVIDTRLALKRYEAERQSLPWFQRFLAGLR